MQKYETANWEFLENGVRILELAKDAYYLYVGQEPEEQHKLLDLLLSNCTLRDRKVSAELTEPFKTLADGAIEEEEMRAANRPNRLLRKFGDPDWIRNLDEIAQNAGLSSQPLYLAMKLIKPIGLVWPAARNKLFTPKL